MKGFANLKEGFAEEDFAEGFVEKSFAEVGFSEACSEGEVSSMIGAQYSSRLLSLIRKNLPFALDGAICGNDHVRHHVRAPIAYRPHVL